MTLCINMATSKRGALSVVPWQLLHPGYINALRCGMDAVFMYPVRTYVHTYNTLVACFPVSMYVSLLFDLCVAKGDCPATHQ